MEEKNLDYLFNDVPLYTKEKFNIFQKNNDMYELNDEELKRFLNYVGIPYKERIITYCHKCKKEFPFSVRKGMFRVYESSENLICFGPFSAVSPRVNIHDGEFYGSDNCYEEELFKNAIYYMIYSFECTNNDSHKYLLVISIEISKGEVTVRKIGQNPSMLTIKGFDFDKYKKILEKIDAYEDYKKADLSNAEHFYVGAFAYLRRIFEKLINTYLDGKKLEDNRMSAKIEAVKQRFDPRISGLLSGLYGILSASIHELDEEQSKEYYEYLKAIIDMQLEYIFTEEEKDKQSSKLSNIISRIQNNIENKSIDN